MDFPHPPQTFPCTHLPPINIKWGGFESSVIAQMIEAGDNFSLFSLIPPAPPPPCTASVCPSTHFSSPLETIVLNCARSMYKAAAVHVHDRRHVHSACDFTVVLRCCCDFASCSLAKALRPSPPMRGTRNPTSCAPHTQTCNNSIPVRIVLDQSPNGPKLAICCQYMPPNDDP